MYEFTTNKTHKWKQIIKFASNDIFPLTDKLELTVKNNTPKSEISEMRFLRNLAGTK